MINPSFVTSTDALRMLNSYGILKRMIELKKIRVHKLTGKDNWYERAPIVEIKKIIDSTMTMEEIKDLLNCSYVFVKNRIKDGYIREVENEVFGKYKRYSKQDVFNYIEYEKNKHVA
jgi:hypothetical protein